MKIAELLSPNRWWNSPTAMTWLSIAAKSGGLLLVTPLVLRFFTPAQTSVWLLFLTINAIAQMADFGFGPSFVRAISYARAGRRDLASAASLLEGPNQALLGEIYGALGKCYARLAVIGGLIALVLGSWALAKPIGQLEAPSEGWGAWAIVWAAALVVFRNSAYAQWLQGMSQIALLRRAEAILAIGTTALTAIVLLITREFLWTVAVAALGAIAASFAVRSLGRRSLCAVEPLPGTTRAEAVYAFIWPAAWRSGVGVLACTVLIQALGVVYAQLAPAAQVAPYLLAIRVIQVITQVSAAPFYSHLPDFAALYALNRREELVAQARRSMSRANSLYVACALAVAILGEPLLRLIGSQVAFVSAPLWLLIATAFFLERFGAMHLQLYSLSNHILWHVVNGVSGILILVFSAALYPLFGVAAFPLALIAGYGGFYCWFSARLVYKHYHQSALNFEVGSSLGPGALLLVALMFSLCL
jgi:O-antigen/teichoic acid export membrane protein